MTPIDRGTQAARRVIRAGALAHVVGCATGMTQKIYSQQQASQFACRNIDGRNPYSEMRIQNADIVGLVEMNLRASGNELARVEIIFARSRRGKGATFAVFASIERAAREKR